MFPNLSHNQMWHSIWNYLTLSNDLLKCEAETQYTICKFAKVQNIFCNEKFKTVKKFQPHLMVGGTEKKGYQES